MQTLDDVIGRLRHLRSSLQERYPIRAIGVFGSYAQGRQTAASDLDVLVDLGEGIGLMGLAGLRQELSDALGIQVDLAIRDALKPRLARRILSEAILI